MVAGMALRGRRHGDGSGWRLAAARRNTATGSAVAASMDSSIGAALAAGGVADITTIGRKSGAPRRKEIFFHTFDGAHYIGGGPASRGLAGQPDGQPRVHASPQAWA